MLRAARRSAGLTQEELATRSGLSTKSISDLERHATRQPYPRSVRQLADALEASDEVRAELQQAAARDGRAGQPPRVAQAPWPVCQLPPLVADFTGRGAESAFVVAALTPALDGQGVPVAVVSGQPGVGKTTLALSAAHALRPSFPDGQLYAQLAGASSRPRDPGEVLGELLRAVGVAPDAVPEGVPPRTALLRSRLADRRVLIVADDAASARQIEPLLPGTPGCAVLVTSRTGLTDLPAARHLRLDCLGHDEAVALLEAIVGAQRLAAEPQAADRLVTACGLLPLAVRIAGAKLVSRPGWPVQRMAELVADERGRLDQLSVADLGVRATMAPSYAALEERSRRGFRRLALLGPVDVPEWLVDALADEADPVTDEAELASVLVDKSLLDVVGDGGEPRYRLHDLLRDYAAERLAAEEPAAQDDALTRVLAGLTELADLADRGLPRLGFFPPRDPAAASGAMSPHQAARLTADPVAWFTAERPVLLAVIRWACDRGQHQAAARLAACLSAFQFFQHRVDDAEEIWRAIHAAAERVSDAATMLDAEFQLGWAFATASSFGEAMEFLDRCVPGLEARGAPDILAAALYWRAFCAVNQGRPEPQGRDAERCLALAKKARNRSMEIMALRVLGVTLAVAGAANDAVAACVRALTIARELGEPMSEYLALTSTAHVALLADRNEFAEDCCRQGMELTDELTIFVTARAYLLGLWGDSCLNGGRYRAAIATLRTAMSAFVQHGGRRGQALCLLRIGEAYLRLGDPGLAVISLGQSLPIFRELGLPEYEAHAVEALEACDKPEPSCTTGSKWLLRQAAG
jgi:transcriptional regulator with XRE-family HTH domain/tetratricopeptide (TPR) repeat protein